MGLKSLATVHKHITNLEKKGMLDRVHNRSRSIDLLPPGSRTRSSLKLPLAGRIAAGLPVEAMETPETISLHDVVGNRDVFALEVRGDSMRDEHIINGDYVLVERTRTARQGEIVVALVHGSGDHAQALLSRGQRGAPAACEYGDGARSTCLPRKWPFRAACWACCASTDRGAWNGDGGSVPHDSTSSCLTRRLRHALGPPHCAFQRNHFFFRHRHLRRAVVQPAKNASRTMAIFAITLPVHATGTSPAMWCLRRSFGAHQQNKPDQIGGGLAQHTDRYRVASLGQLVDRRRQRGKIRTRRAVAQVDELVHVGRAPDLAHRGNDLRRAPRDREHGARGESS